MLDKITVTLRNKSNDFYDIYIDVGGTDGSAKVTVGSTSDYFYGSVLVLDNADDKHALQTAVKATSAATPTSFDWLLLDGDSNNTGGAVGGVINIKCVTANAWQVTAVLSTSGTPTSIATIYAG